MDAEINERLTTELSLLESMYPGQFGFEQRGREVHYGSDGATLKLRLPDGYLRIELPEVLVAVTQTRIDLRDQLMKFIVNQCSPGEEILDSIVSSFNGLVEAAISQEDKHVSNEVVAPTDTHTRACVVVWLHHLLNTNKRKQALAPTLPGISGLTKPGYPGVLVYSGPAHAVQQHVNELKRLNWQAFQVRIESDEEWTFVHGTGIVEVEAMKDVVADIGECRKEEFMEAMRMK